MRGDLAARGLSILELLVALALGLLVLVAVLVSASGVLVSARQQQALSSMTSDAMLALSLIRRDLQMAGYVHPVSVAHSRFMPAHATAVTRAILGCSQGFDNPQAAPGQGVCKAAAGGGDAIEINFEATGRSAALSSDGRLIDCQGTELPDPAVPGRPAPRVTEDLRVPTVHRYFVQASSVTQAPELSCASSASATREPLVPQVEGLRVRYGVAQGWRIDDPETRRPVRYVEADQVTDWSSVVAVRLCLLIRSDRPVLDGSEAQTRGYLDCDGSRQISSDQRLRRAYVTTVSLRHRVAR